MERFDRVLEQHTQDVLARWTEGVKSLAAGRAVSTVEIVDHVPLFLEELAGALRLAVAPPAETRGTSTAAKHGDQRFRLGFDLDSVVREYGILHTCVLEVTHEHGVDATLDEQRILAQAINDGIAGAIGQYMRQRDAELLRQANEHFAFVAHELRNPLGSAELALSSLTGKGLIPKTPMAEALARGLRRMKELIESTLSLMLASHAPELRLAPLKVSEAVRDAVHESAPGAQDKEVTVIVEASADVKIEADERLLHSALTNLLNNAVKFTKRGCPINVHWQEREGILSLEIADSCGGLPPDAAAKIFAPFVQVGENRSGFGLGLAIARKAVLAHGGTIHVRNRPEVGCTFVVELPVARSGVATEAKRQD
jgi:signal transduction histidine kinase